MYVAKCITCFKELRCDSFPFVEDRWQLLFEEWDISRIEIKLEKTEDKAYLRKSLMYRD